MICSGCHKTMYEDKFMLNKMNKRYRSCINCVSRARISRQSKDKTQHKTTLKNNNLLALLDKEYNDDEKISLEENNDSIASIETRDELIIPTVKPNNEKMKQVKPKKKFKQ